MANRVHLEGPEPERVRLDTWLWATRFFKTRSLAHEAIEGGKVVISGARIKPSKPVTVGLTLSINCPRGRFEVVVEKLSSKRVGAPIAATFFCETEESIRTRETTNELRSLANSTAPRERPNSQDRDRIRRLKEGG
jgi:ribosome-associated heat shock protein Hsp15